MGWESVDGHVPIDPGIESRLVAAIEGISAIWQTYPPGQEEPSPVPVAIFNFMLRDGDVCTVVLTMAGIASLNAEIADHFVALLGGVAAIEGTVDDEAIQRMIDQQEGDGDES